MNQRSKNVAQLLLVPSLLLFLSGNAYAHAGADYKGHWAEKQIEEWVHKGLIAGYNDDTFQPDRPISRAEFVTLVNRVFHFTEKAATPFADVPAGAWYEEEAAKGAAAGYISGDSAGHFNPNEPLKRVEAAKILSDVLKWEASGETDHLTQFKDASNVPEWAKPFLSRAVEQKIITGSSDNWILPLKKVTRAEAVTYLYQAAGGKLDSQSVPVVKAEQVLEGYLIDKHCFGHGDPGHETKMCLTMKKCSESGYGVAVKQPDGTFKFFLFDEKGQALAKEYLNNTTKENDFVIQVIGVVDGEDVQVISLEDK